MGVQQFFIAIFCIFMIRFNIRQRQGYGYAGKGDWRPLIYALYATLVCITVSTIHIFRRELQYLAP